MTTDDTGHDIQAYAVQGGAASARCDTHKAGTAVLWSSLSEAYTGFRCDSGRDWRFITESARDETDRVLVMCDLSGLARIVHSDAEARAYGTDDPETRAWLWLGAGQLEELQVSMQHMTEFNEADYAYQTWAVTRTGGDVITTVRVRIDGRA